MTSNQKHDARLRFSAWVEGLEAYEYLVLMYNPSGSCVVCGGSGVLPDGTSDIDRLEHACFTFTIQR